jgi:hypothetical protein
MKHTPICLLAAFLATCLTSPAHASGILIGGSTRNGNLDRAYAQEIVPGFFLPKPQVWTNYGWRVISGPTEDDLDSEPWAGPAPTPITTDGNLNPPHPQGCGGPDCGVFFKPFAGNSTNGALTAHLYQILPATPGASYIFKGWAGAEANVLATDLQIAVEFLDAGYAVIPASGQIVSLIPSIFVPNGAAFNYKMYTAGAVAPAGTVSVRARISLILGLANPGGGGQAFVVDDFTLAEDLLFADGFESGNLTAWSNF